MVNASPDSKADFSVVQDYAEAAARGAELLAEGADHFDLGGEGSTPGSDEVSAADEWQRVEGPLRGLLSLGAEVAIDTRKPDIARRALEAGATVLNAGDALQSPEMVELAACSGVPVVLPFMLGRDFRSVRDVRGDPVTVMVEWFASRIERLRQAGVTQQLLLDCGVGFGPARHGLAANEPRTSGPSTADWANSAASICPCTSQCLGCRPQTASNCSTWPSHNNPTTSELTAPPKSATTTPPSPQPARPPLAGSGVSRRRVRGLPGRACGAG